MVVARRNKPWKARWNLTPNPKTPFSFPVSTLLPSYINSFFKGEGQKRRRRHTHSHQLFFALTQQAPTTTSTTEQYSHGFRLRHSQRTFRASEAPISLPTWPSSLPSGISLPTLLFLILSSVLFIISLWISRAVTFPTIFMLKFRRTDHFQRGYIGVRSLLLRSTYVLRIEAVDMNWSCFYLLFSSG